MSVEDTLFQDLERKPNKRRSSILKRQDTGLITEDGGDEGPRTPRRVSFARNHMIKEFYSAAWSSHDESSLHSQGCQSSTGSEDSHVATTAGDCHENLPEQQNMDNAGIIQPPSSQGMEMEDETSAMIPNRTIHFGDLDETAGVMEITSNLMEISQSFTTGEQGQVDPWLNSNQKDWGSVSSLQHLTNAQQTQIMEQTQNIGGDNWGASVSSLQHLTNAQQTQVMEQTQNIGGDIWNTNEPNEPTNRYFFQTNAMEMELTQDTVGLPSDTSSYFSRGALLDITDLTPAALPVTDGKPPVKKLAAVSPEDQENNPLLILQKSVPVSSTSIFNSSDMAITECLIGSDEQNLSPMTASIPGPAHNLKPALALNHADSRSLASRRKQNCLSDQLMAPQLSPVGEVSGLNSSSWMKESDRSISSRTALPASNNDELQKQHGMPCDEAESEPEPQTKTVYFETPHSEGSGMYSGDMEVTKNISPLKEVLCSLPADGSQARKTTKQADPSPDHPQETGNFNPTDVSQDMNLTESCSTSDSEVGPSFPHSHSPRHLSAVPGQYHRGLNQEKLSLPPGHGVVFEDQLKTIYFGSNSDTTGGDGEDCENAGDMTLTKTVAFFGGGNTSQADEDPEVQFKFFPHASVSRKLLPGNSEMLMRPQETSLNISSSQGSQSLNKSSVEKDSSFKTHRAFETPAESMINEQEKDSNESKEITPVVSYDRYSDPGMNGSEVSTSSDRLEGSAKDNVMQGERKSAINLENEGSNIPLQESNSSFHTSTHSNNEVNEKEAKKSSLIKDLSNYMAFSRLSLSKLNFRKSTGGLLLGRHNETKAYGDLSSSGFKPRKPLVHVRQKSRLNEDEVDGMNCSNSKLSTTLQGPPCPSAIVSVVSDRNVSTIPSAPNNREPSSIVSALDESHASQASARNRNSSINVSNLDERNTSISGLAQNGGQVNTSSREFSALQHTSSINVPPNGNSSTVSSELAERNISLVGACPNNDVTPLQQSTAYISPTMDPVTDGVELTDELDLNDESLNFHNFPEDHYFAEEEDLVHDLDNVISQPTVLGHKYQPFTLQDMYRSIGFEPDPSKEDLLPQGQFETDSVKGKIHATITAVPEVEALQEFVADMEQKVNKLKQENTEKLEAVRERLHTVGSQLVQDNGLKSRALDMCRACRVTAKNKLRHLEADYLLRYSTLREEAFKKLTSDIEILETDTVKCDDAISEIDKCLQKIDLIHGIKQNILLQETKLEETKIETSHLQNQIQEMDEKIKSVQDENENLLKMTEDTVSEQEVIQEQLSLLGSLTEWTILKNSSQEMHFGFLFNTLVLKIEFSGGPKPGMISSLFFKSRLSEFSKPWAKLCHHLAHTSIDCKAWKDKYKSKDQLSRLLFEVSKVICNCRQLSTELRQINLKHRLSISGSNLEIYILERKSRQKVRLETSFDAPCGYPETKLNWIITIVLGDITSEKVTQEIDRILPGDLYLTRTLEAVHSALAQFKT